MVALDFNTLNSFHLDVLREIGNIGAGNAATALAKILDKRVDMKVPQVRVMDFSEISDMLGGAETQVVGILLGVEGDISGNMCLYLIYRALSCLLIFLWAGHQKLIWTTMRLLTQP